MSESSLTALSLAICQMLLNVKFISRFNSWIHVLVSILPVFVRVLVQNKWQRLGIFIIEQSRKYKSMYKIMLVVFLLLEMHNHFHVNTFVL